MQEKTEAQILNDAADHIEANGLLFDAWESKDGTEDLPLCCCLYGTLRLVIGLPPAPPWGMVLDGTHGVLAETLKALGAQTEPDRKALGEMRYGHPGSPLTVMQWGDHYADVEAVRRKGRDGKPEIRRLEHEDGDRGHVVRVLRQAAGRCES